MTICPLFSVIVYTSTLEENTTSINRKEIALKGDASSRSSMSVDKIFYVVKNARSNG
jgi:hypothetical protein